MGGRPVENRSHDVTSFIVPGIPPRHQTINEVIMPDILKMALEYQKGRGIDEYAQGHNFTERWFRGTNPR